MNEKLKSRKLWFFVGLALLFTVMQVNGNLPANGEVYASLMTIDMVAFAGGNVGEHFSNKP